MKKFSFPLFMLIVTFVAYFIVKEPTEAKDAPVTMLKSERYQKDTLAVKLNVETNKKRDHLHAGSDELYPDMGYDEDGWSNRGYMSSSEFQGKHLKGNMNKLSRLLKRIVKERNIFINDISKKAIDISNSYDIPASIITAQAILESGYGTSRLAVVANNLFGHMGGKTAKSRGISGSIKAYDKNIDGKTKNYSFRVYESVWWSMWNHAHLLNNNYASRLIKSTNKREAWLAAICGCKDNRMLASDSKKLATNGGYLYASSCAWKAKDGVTSRYIAELQYIIKKYNLEKLDE